MTESVLQSQREGRESLAVSPVGQVRRLVWKIAIATLVLMAIGSATRVMNAGLACPDWPLCYGKWVPSGYWNLQVFLEWFHRLDASLIGASTLFLVGLCWWRRQQLPDWVPIAATIALGTVVFQAVLGGLTVTELLRFDIVTAHLGMALLFFCILIAMGTALSDYRGTAIAGKLSGLGAIAAVLVYVQSLAGGLVASRWSLHQCLSNSQLCAVMNGHIFGVFPAAIATVVLSIWAWRTPGLHRALRRLAAWAGALVGLQVLLGIATYHLHLQVEPLTVSHQAIGAALLGVLVAFSVLAYRDRLPAN